MMTAGFQFQTQSHPAGRIAGNQAATAAELVLDA